MVDEFTQHITQLLVQVSRAHRARAESLLNQLNLHTGQEFVLLQLAEAPDGMRLSELAECMNVEAPTVTKTIQRMEREGFVERRPDPDDARATRVSLTAAGQALREPVQAIWRELEATTLAGLSDAEKLLLRRMLLTMRANLEDH